MQHWTLNTAEQWETLTGKPYGQFFESLKETEQRKVSDMAVLLVCEAYNSNPELNVEEELANIKRLTMEQIWEQISQIFGADTSKKKKE